MKKCPRCKKEFEGHPAISRRDNKTEICSDCGIQEAIFDFKLYQVHTKINQKTKQEKSWLS